MLNKTRLINVGARETSDRAVVVPGGYPGILRGLIRESWRSRTNLGPFIVAETSGFLRAAAMVTTPIGEEADNGPKANLRISATTTVTGWLDW